MTEKNIYNQILDLLPKNIIITYEQFKMAYDYHMDMVEKFPKKEIMYFFGNSNKSDVDYILTKISENLFYNECHKRNSHGNFEIIELLLNKELPENIVMFYVNYGQFDSIELNIICREYGYNSINVTPLSIVEEYCAFMNMYGEKDNFDKISRKEIRTMYQTRYPNLKFEKFKKIKNADYDSFDRFSDLFLSDNQKCVLELTIPFFNNIN